MIAMSAGDLLYDIVAVVLVALVFVGAIPLVVATYQFARVGLHRWFSHSAKSSRTCPEWRSSSRPGTRGR